MLFTYRATIVNRETSRLENIATSVDTDKWLDFMRRDEKGLYGNSADLVEQHLLPLLAGDDLEAIYNLVLQLYEGWRPRNGIVIFQLAMFVWAGYKAGRYSADVWATVLAVAWQSGSRGMLAATKLTQSQVIEMFKAAPRHTLLRMGEFEGEDLNRDYDALPESIQVFRGVSTGIDHFEDGFSWTLDVAQCKTFSTLNCQNSKEIPGFVIATIPKDAILAMFSYENEVVVDPTVPKTDVSKYFLRGKELRDFHRQVDVDANTRDVIFRTGYEANRKSNIADAGMASAHQNYVSGTY
jgi:hypothetical protein